MVELPVVVEEGEGYRIIAGHHRIRAWEEIGHEEVECVVLPPEAIGSREEEFNLVNDLNRARGQTSDSELLRIVRREDLHPEAIDVHGLPRDLLAPTIRPEDLAALDEAAARRARILEVTHRVSREIAQVMVDERDEVVTVLVVEDKVAAVFRLPLRNPVAARRAAPVLRQRIEAFLTEALAEVIEEG